MKTVAFACVVAVCAGGADAFVGSSMRPASMRRAGPSSVRMASEVTTVPDLLRQTEQLKLLSTASKLGLLSKLEEAGLTLKDVEKLLPLVDENDLIGLAKGVAPDLLKIAPKALAAAPAALPLLAAALSIQAQTLYAAAAASVIAGAGLVYVLPDSSLGGVAIETFVAVPLLFVFPAVFGVGGFALSSLKNGSLVDLLTSSSPGVVSSPPSSSGVSLPSSPFPEAKKSGRPTITAAKAAPAPAPKKIVAKRVYKPAPKPKPMGNIGNLPKAL